MKIKVYVVDLELPRWARRLLSAALAAGAVAGVTLGAVAVARAAWGTPPTFAPQAPLLAKDMKVVSDDLTDLDTRVKVVQQERIVHALIKCYTASCDHAVQGGNFPGASNWVSGLTKPSAGTYQVSIASGTFSTAPTCTATQVGGGSVGFIMLQSTATTVNLNSYNSAANTLIDWDFSLICFGSP